MSAQPDLAPEGAVWVCEVCWDSAKNKADLRTKGCQLNVLLVHDDMETDGITYRWRLYEPRG